MMYDHLIDTVSQIVKTYGTGIISDTKFWYILTDSYNFQSEPKLKTVFKDCIDLGYFRQLLTRPFLFRKYPTEIHKIATTYENVHPDTESEIVGSLFAICIATGKVSMDDYSKYIGVHNHPNSTGNTPQPKPSTSPTTPNKPTPKSKRKNLNWGDIKIWGTACLGIILLWGSTLFYGAFLAGGWWMFFIVLLTGILQLGYLGHCNEIALNDKKTYFVVLPILYGFFLNATVPLLLCNDTIRHYCNTYFELWGSNTYFELWGSDSPGSLSIVLSIICVLIFAAIALGTTFELDSYILKNKCSQKQCLIVLAVILLGYGVLFSLPPLHRYSERMDEAARIKSLKEEKDNLRAYNDSLISIRRNISRDLSFKGISLGMPYDSAKNAITSLNDFRTDNSSNLDYSFKVISCKSIITDILNESESVMSETTNLNAYWGHYYGGYTTLDNNEIYFQAKEYNGVIFCIVVKKSQWRSSGNFDDFDSLKSLYTKKYGEPEILRDFPSEEDIAGNRYYDYSYIPEIYEWTFKNGKIRLSPTEIVYISMDFINQAKRRYEDSQRIANEKARRYNDSIAVVQRAQDSIRREEIRIEEARKDKNHKNAINEI